jgi:hypothetical protein
MSSAVPNFLMLLRSAVALALLIAPFVAVERAQAACAPKSPISDATVTCTGATSNQNAPLGYDRATDTRNPIGSAAIGLLHCNRAKVAAKFSPTNCQAKDISTYRIALWRTTSPSCHRWRACGVRRYHA